MALTFFFISSHIDISLKKFLDFSEINMLEKLSRHFHKKSQETVLLDMFVYTKNIVILKSNTYKNGGVKKT